MMLRFCLLSLFSLSFFSAQLNEKVINQSSEKQIYTYKNENFSYSKPKFSHVYKDIPKNFVGTAKDIVSKAYYPYSLGALGATVALIPLDPYFIQGSRNLGESIGFGEDHKYNKLGFLKIIPADVHSFLYFLGNGTTVILISAGVGTFGLLKNDYRAQSTSLQLLESIAQSGLFVQPIKRLTGRESPFMTSGRGGWHSSWQFAPSFAAYQKNTSNYDAMPSGHVTTAMAALTVLTENYPEKKWLKPVGYTVIGLMSFEMMQSKVHWISDYPIAILLGYLIGKNIVASKRIKENSNQTYVPPKKYKLSLSASKFYEFQCIGVNLKF